MPYSATQYLLDDLPRTLFPLATTRYLVETGTDRLYDHLYKEVLGQPRTGAFLPQTLCHAAKSQFHL
jgi:hypothetical protein